MILEQNTEISSCRESGGVKLKSLEEWMEIADTFKRQYGRCETNCYVPLPVLEEYIHEGRLCYQVISNEPTAAETPSECGHSGLPGMPKGTLWLYERERDYDLGYYYVPKEGKLDVRRRKRDVMIYLVGTEKRYAGKREEELIHAGCEKYRRNLEYMVSRDKIPELERMDKKCRRLMEKMGFTYGAFCEKDYEDVFGLWRDRIDRYSVKDMLKSRIRRMEEKEECMMLRDIKGEIAAACVFEINGDVGLSENIATNGAYNGIGIGGILLSGSLLSIFSRGCSKDCMWVWEGNTESRRMTERFAVMTGRFSQQLLLKGSEDS